VIARALVVWFGILLLAVLNGGVRNIWLVPCLGDTVGRALSTVALSALVILMTWLTIGWIGPRTTKDAWMVGLLWVSLTLAFEFLAGHYLFNKHWAVLLDDYDVRRGRIWVAVLVITLLAPQWAVRVRGP
jgi:hypothetical protein